MESNSGQNIALSSVFGTMVRKMMVTVKSCTDTSFLESLYAVDNLANVFISAVSSKCTSCK